LQFGKSRAQKGQEEKVQEAQERKVRSGKETKPTSPIKIVDLYSKIYFIYIVS